MCQVCQLLYKCLYDHLIAQKHCIIYTKPITDFFLKIYFLSSLSDVFFYKFNTKCIYRLQTFTVVPFFHGPTMSGHPLCRDSLSMYGLFCHVNIPLTKGRGQQTGYFGYMSLLKLTLGENTAKNHKLFCLQDGGRHDTCLQ